MPAVDEDGVANIDPKVEDIHTPGYPYQRCVHYGPANNRKTRIINIPFNDIDDADKILKEIAAGESKVKGYDLVLKNNMEETTKLASKVPPLPTEIQTKIQQNKTLRQQWKNDIETLDKKILSTKVEREVLYRKHIPLDNQGNPLVGDLVEDGDDLVFVTANGVTIPIVIPADEMYLETKYRKAITKSAHLAALYQEAINNNKKIMRKFTRPLENELEPDIIPLNPTDEFVERKDAAIHKLIDRRTEIRNDLQFTGDKDELTIANTLAEQYTTLANIERRTLTHFKDNNNLQEYEEYDRYFNDVDS
jgi:hypothetical protein